VQGNKATERRVHLDQERVGVQDLDLQPQRMSAAKWFLSRKEMISKSSYSSIFIKGIGWDKMIVYN
jgi:hypothetical protein